MEFAVNLDLSQLLCLAQTSQPLAPGGTPVDGRGWQVVVVTLMSSFIAQALKVVTKLVKTGKLDLRMVGFLPLPLSF